MTLIENAFGTGRQSPSVVWRLSLHFASDTEHAVDGSGLPWIVSCPRLLKQYASGGGGGFGGSGFGAGGGGGGASSFEPHAATATTSNRASLMAAEPSTRGSLGARVVLHRAEHVSLGVLEEHQRADTDDHRSLEHDLAARRLDRLLRRI